MKRPPKEIVWHVMIYGPAVIMLALGIGIVIWQGWREGWVSGAAYAVAGANMWLASSRILPNYRYGYSHGRLDLLLERMGARPERGPGDDPGPWDDPISDDELARIMREAAERMGREQDD